jgi:hypothetical protein
MITENCVVQINEKGDPNWIGCFVHVTEVKSWGIQGFVKIPAQGNAYIRLEFDKIEFIGDAVLVPQDE